MCGIVGYIGKRGATPILLDGLKKLEYRGYDSAGLAVFVGQSEIKSIKRVGRVSVLEEEALKENFSGTLGIAHTRWATHGAVTEANAHPHSDCSGNVWLAHNGIIENYKELRASLIKSGHRFKSDTDTEVLPHLIEEERKQNPGNSLEDLIASALKNIKGAYGIVVIDSESPDKLVAVRNFSPLLLGIGDNEYIVASDASAVLRYTKNAIYFDNGEMAVITPDSHRIFDLNHNTIQKKPEKIEWSPENIRKGEYPHFMLKEIFEQPEALRDSVRGRMIAGDGLAKLGGLDGVKERLRKIKKIHIAACGTAYLAGKIGEYVIEEYGGIPAEADLASELRYRKPVFEANEAMLVISQSGETADTLAALKEAREKSVLTLGIVNVVGSTIARETDAGVYQHAGPEIGVASTKAFISQLAILDLFALLLGRQRNMSVATGQRICKELDKLPLMAEKILDQKDRIKNLAEKYLKFNNFFYLGRKYNYPIAMEGALKLKEISYVHAEGYSAGEMKHGPIAMIDKNFPSIAIVPSDSVYEKMVSNIEEIKARNGPVIVIATEGNSEIQSLADDVIYIPKTLEMLTPILSVIPLQLFAYYFAVLRGCDVDKPRNLAKSVTVE